MGSTSRVQYVYDGLDRLEISDFPASAAPSADVGTVYDRNGNVESRTKGTTRWDYIYDENDNLEYETLTISSAPYQVHRTYDPLDVLKEVTYPDGLIVDYAPNALGRPTRVGNYVTSLTYHPNGQVEGITFANGHLETLSQDERLLPKSLLVTAPLVVDKLYEYDAAGNVGRVTDSVNSAHSKVLGYNGWNEITSASGQWGAATFVYDQRANITTKNMGALGNVAINYSPTTNRIDNVNGNSYSYDGLGNVTSRQLGGRVFDYDDASAMVRAQAFGTLPQVDYGYDGNGMRARELVTNILDRRAFYSQAGTKLYEHEAINGEEIDYVYLGARLVATRSQCASSTDTDGDGMPNCAEARVGMNPISSNDAALDNDGDGLTNLQEYQSGTLINNIDTDADGMDDRYEVQYGLGALTSNANADADGDTLTNLQEFELGTNPTNSDSDNDGVPDATDPNPLFNPAIVPILQLILE